MVRAVATGELCRYMNMCLYSCASAGRLSIAMQLFFPNFKSSKVVLDENKGDGTMDGFFFAEEEEEGLIMMGVSADGTA
jgi:hypothetical protein